MRIYLVDDHDIVRRGLRDLLVASPDIMVVGEAASAANAVRDIVAREPDVMLLDLHLQDGTGIGVCRQVQASTPRVKGLLLTAAGDDEALVATVLAGAAGYVIKASPSHVIVGAIRALGAGKPVLEPDQRELVVQSLRALTEGRGGPFPDSSDRKVLQAILDGENDNEIMERLRLSRPDLDHHLSVVIEHLLGVPSTPRHRRGP